MKKKKTYNLILASILGWGIVVLLMYLFGRDLSDSWQPLAIGFLTYIVLLSVIQYFMSKI